MKKGTCCRATFTVLLFVSIFCRSLNAQTAASDLTATILHNDSLFWNAYNQCDIGKMKKWITDDVEFYHDKGGITLGNENLVLSIKNGLCSNKDFRIRREAVPGTVQVFPLRKADTIYGAIISGEHYFYITQNGQKEFLDGHARFTHLWLLKDGVWKMSRILSYDHGPAAYINKRKEMTLPETALRQFTGRYKGPQTNNLLIREEKGGLVLVTGNTKMRLYPETKTLFFAKERDLTFEFTGSGQGRGIRVRERGEIVEELKFETS